MSTCSACCVLGYLEYDLRLAAIQRAVTKDRRNVIGPTLFKTVSSINLGEQGMWFAEPSAKDDPGLPLGPLRLPHEPPQIPLRHILVALRSVEHLIRLSDRLGVDVPVGQGGFRGLCHLGPRRSLYIGICPDFDLPSDHRSRKQRCPRGGLTCQFSLHHSVICARSSNMAFEPRASGSRFAISPLSQSIQSTNDFPPTSSFGSAARALNSARRARILVISSQYSAMLPNRRKLLLLILRLLSMSRWRASSGHQIRKAA